MKIELSQKATSFHLFLTQANCPSTCCQNVRKGAGVKILKIYNWQKWQQLARGLPLQIIRGDDSYFKEESKKKDSKNEESQYASIKSEEDLFNNTEIVDEGISENDKSNLIKQDNIVSLNYGTYSNCWK